MSLRFLKLPEELQYQLNGILLKHSKQTIFPVVDTFISQKSLEQLQYNTNIFPSFLLISENQSIEKRIVSYSFVNSNKLILLLFVCVYFFKICYDWRFHHHAKKTSQDVLRIFSKYQLFIQNFSRQQFITTVTEYKWYMTPSSLYSS